MKQKTWISNEAQLGIQTVNGMWHSKPHPFLAKQIMRKGYGDKPRTDRWWHPDYVLFKAQAGWYADHRTSSRLDGPYRTKAEAKATAAWYEESNHKEID